MPPTDAATNQRVYGKRSLAVGIPSSAISLLRLRAETFTARCKTLAMLHIHLYSHRQVLRDVIRSPAGAERSHTDRQQNVES